MDLGSAGEFLEREASKYEIRSEKISKKGGWIHHIRIDDNIEAAVYYRKHFDILRKATEKDEIKLYISSYGGYLDTAVQFVYALTDTKAETESIVYLAASAATLLAFATDKVTLKPISTIMLHNFSVAQQGKGNELRAKTAYDDTQFMAICDMLYSNLLTKEEIKDLQLDKDFWFLGREVAARMEKYKWKPIRDRKEYGKL